MVEKATVEMVGALSWISKLIRGVQVAHPTMPLWCICESLFKANNDSGSRSQEMAPTLGLGQIWDPINTQFFEGLELSQQSRRQYMEFEQSNAYDTCTQHIHWSP
ncbi:hypothetical protein Gotur_008725 [Gossypium turneri]